MKHFSEPHTVADPTPTENDATRRFKELISREETTLYTIKDALLEVMKRDGQATWASVAIYLAEMRRSAGEFGKVRIDASIAHLRRLAQTEMGYAAANGSDVLAERPAAPAPHGAVSAGVPQTEQTPAS